MILGAGVTGLTAGLASGLPVFEAIEEPEGICSSYQIRPGDRGRLHVAPADGEAYRFELRYLDNDTCSMALQEMSRPGGRFRTMKEWLEESCGRTLSELFFEPFHDLQTAGLHQRIAPQDPYKSPLSLAQVIRGAFEEAAAVGYNVTYGYPLVGLNALTAYSGRS